MKTADLIEALASDDTAMRARPIVGPLVASALAGAAVSALIVVFVLGLRPLDQAVHSRMFWMKGLYTLCLAVAGGAGSIRLARPGGATGWTTALAGAAVAFMLVMGGLDLARASSQSAGHEWLGNSWTVCPWYILGLAVPVYAAVAWVMRRMAPTRLRLAGAAAGLFAGGVAGTVYGLHCPESAAAFIATWYTLGIAAAAGLGALLGPRALRW